jgi:hypothetical protein
VLGKLASALASPEPQLQHAALHLSGRCWEPLPLPAPGCSGPLVVAPDLHRHEAVAVSTATAGRTAFHLLQTGRSPKSLRLRTACGSKIFVSHLVLEPVRRAVSSMR